MGTLLFMTEIINRLTEREVMLRSVMTIPGKLTGIRHGG
jgi:hypothetical protein